MRTTSSHDVGHNRTGVALSPADARLAAEFARLGTPTSTGGLRPIAGERLLHAQSAAPIGSMPPPTTRGTTAGAGARPTLFLDLCGERLAFERTGVRLYQAVIDKLPAFADGRVGLDELRAFQGEELRHVELLRRTIDELGGDATALTPGADVMGVATGGLVQVVSDPRTDVGEMLGALVAVELLDNDAWELLITLARRLEREATAVAFRRAAEEEQQHLMRVRGWLTAVTLREAGLAQDVAVPPPAP